ncbi:hypothetical protein B5S31_g5068 [[Candida] boidinii]|nr:hypothetical protein B5S31_g5068 [[Candida] boidinii]OWB80896.1 hypothetical protein B5S32_g5220 [[Candida] boidinii]
METDKFYRDKHIKYFNRCLGILPSKYESEDSNKLALIYFSLAGLDLLGALDEIPQTTKDEYKEWVYMHYISTKEGFRGSAIYDLHDHDNHGDDDNDNSYDKPNLAATCFALQILIILKDENLVKRIDRYKILNYLVKCQLENGSFAPGLDIYGYPFGENDLRYCMLASTIRFLLGFSNGVKSQNYNNNNYQDINILKFQEYIKSIQSYDGGFGIFKMSESHAGICFCGLSGLILSDNNNNNQDKIIEKLNIEKLTKFLVFRQVSSDEGDGGDGDGDGDGGFNGRLNKDSDTCYCFWVMSSLFLIKRQNLIDFDKLSKFLINHTQNKVMGGFNKSIDPDETPDPLHSFLGLAALSLISNDDNDYNNDNKSSNPFLTGLNLNLKKLDPKVVISKESYDFGINLKWE